MGAAEERDGSVAVSDRRELEEARKLAVRLLELIGKLESRVDRPGLAKVEPTAPTADDFAELRARRRRRAHRNG